MSISENPFVNPSDDEAYEQRESEKLRILPEYDTANGLSERQMKEALGMAIGAASVCWNPMDGTGVFMSQRAGQIVDELFALVNEYARKKAEPVQTGMRLHDTVKSSASGHVCRRARLCDHEVPRAIIEVNRIGWLDQKGQVWLSDRDWMNAGGPNGSITPLFIAPGCE